MKVLFIATRVPDSKGRADQITTARALAFLEEMGHEVRLVVLAGPEITVSSIFMVVYRMVRFLSPGQVALYETRNNKEMLESEFASVNYDKVYFHLSRSCIFSELGFQDGNYVGLQVSQFINLGRTARGFVNPIKRLAFFIESILSLRFEKKIIGRATKTNFVGFAERRLFESEFGAITVIPHGVDFDEWRLPQQQREGAVYLANFGSYANKQSLRFLLDEVWPLVVEGDPRMKLTIAGREMPAWAKEVQLPNLEVVGEVPSADQFLRQYSIFINPVSASAGMQNKVIAALGAGLICVVTDSSVEGMKLDSELLHVVNDPHELAQKLIQVNTTDISDEKRRLEAFKIRSSWSWSSLHREWSAEFLNLPLAGLQP